MLLREVVDTAGAVAATRSRRDKTALLADLLRRLGPDDVAAAVGLLLGRPRQGRVGVGWRTLLDAREGCAPDSPPPADPPPPLDDDKATGTPPPLAQLGTNAPPLTVADVDAALELVAGTHGGGSASARREALRALFARADADEADFLVRAIGGEVRTGALAGVLTDAIAAAGEVPAATARRAAMLSGDLATTARLALTAPEQLASVGLSVGTPVLPMLASPGGDTESSVTALGEASVEYKLDGVRIQVHRSGDDVAVYTRSLADITARVPELVEAARALPARELILDGETLLLAEDGSPRPFQETMSRFGGQDAAARVLRPWFFDVLHADGQDLIDEPLRVRRGILSEVVGDLRVPSILTSDPAVAEDFSRQALAAGHEGIVLKGLDSPYAAGRRGKDWQKVKPVLTLDLVVLGVEWGSGRRSGWLSNIHLGARDADGSVGEPGGMVMVGKTFKGMTDEILRWQTEHFPTIETRRTRSTVFVEPVTVVEVAIDGVQRSARYPGGVALRFARVKGYRLDKSPTEADTLATLRALLPPEP
ncbi:MAG: ATP-dependent DNA ligase [Micrococcales bacterium]|nr:ATP-dependent DNA ligase [Micrococcales bacterium]